MFYCIEKLQNSNIRSKHNNLLKDVMELYMGAVEFEIPAEVLSNIKK